MALSSHQVETLLTPAEIPVYSPGGMYNVSLTGNILLAGISAADIVTSFTPGHRFKIVAMSATAIVAPTTSAKAATVTPYISGTATTGGVLAMTSASLTTKGTVQAATAITGANEGTATDTISLTGSSVTAFVEGSVNIVLRIQNLDG